MHLSKPERPSRLCPWLNSVQRPHKSQPKLAPEPAVSRLNPKVFNRHLVSPYAQRELPFPQIHITFSQFFASPPANKRYFSQGALSGGEKHPQPTQSHRADARATARGAYFAESGVWPNPSLSRDPTRQAAWASWHLRLCCATPPKRLAARVAVSSNVRPQKPCACSPPKPISRHR